MSELSDLYNAWREVKNEKKQIYIRHALETFQKENIPILILDQVSMHIRVYNFDFWPTTGLFIDRKTRLKGRGINNLLKRMNQTWKSTPKHDRSAALEKSNETTKA